MVQLISVGVRTVRVLRGSHRWVVTSCALCTPWWGSRAVGAPAGEWGTLEIRKQECEDKELFKRTPPLWLVHLVGDYRRCLFINVLQTLFGSVASFYMREVNGSSEVSTGARTRTGHLPYWQLACREWPEGRCHRSLVPKHCLGNNIPLLLFFKCLSLDNLLMLSKPQFSLL